MTVIAIGTSLPEFFVLLKSAYIDEYSNNLVYGTILGSNMANTCLILGISLVLTFKTGFKYKLKNLNFNYLLIIISTLCFYLFSQAVINNTLLCSIILVTCAFFYTSSKTEEIEDPGSSISIILMIIYLLIGPLIIWFAAEGITSTGLEIIKKMGLSSAFVASVFLALSTSFPEIITTLISILKYGKNDFVLGNIIGSNIANFLIFSVINLIFIVPIPDFKELSLLSILIAEICLFSIVFIYRKNNSIPNSCGIFLVLLYIIFIVNL
jgi:cation:H+ antiporter|tara:strand:- start:10068 stop:10868 length:801 start_codon:yes stop_codon:yes gene_type:complete